MAGIFQSKAFLIGGGAALLLAVGGVMVATQYVGRSNSGSSEKMAALKAMRDSGAITQAQYDQDLAQGGAGQTGDPLADKIAALQELRDSGTITKEEYEQKVVALSTETAMPDGGNSPGGNPANNSPFANPPSETSSQPQQTSSDGNGGGGFFSRLVSGGGSQKTVQVQDPMLNMAALSLTLPQDWRFAGTVVRANDCASTGAAVKFTASSGDGSTADEVFPGIAYVWAQNPQMNAQYRQQGCIVLQSTSPADFLRQVVLPHLRPNAQIGEIGPDPALTQTIEQMRGQVQQTLQRQAAAYHQPAAQSWVDSARARVSYTRDGKPVEEWVSTIVQCARYMMPSVMPGQGPSADQHCTAVALEILRAPQGQLDDFQAKIKGTVQIATNQQWQERVAQMAEAQAQQQGQQSADQARQIRENGEQQGQQGRNMLAQTNQNIARTGQMSMQSARDSENMRHQGAQGFINHMSDTNGFSNSNTGEGMQLSNQYSHSYQNGQTGNVVQTNSSYAPGPSSTWTELQPQ